MRVVEVLGFDHLVLRCTDVERSLAWYMDELGLPGERVHEWREGAAPFPSVRIDGGAIVDLIGRPAEGDGRNLDHFCVVVTADTVDRVDADRERFRVVDGPAVRYGARGDGWSIYVMDPDGNVVELRSYDHPSGKGG